MTCKTLLAHLDGGQDNAAVLRGRADLVVAGADGHNRLRAWAIGGMTRALQKGDRCMLLSH